MTSEGEAEGKSLLGTSRWPLSLREMIRQQGVGLGENLELQTSRRKEGKKKERTESAFYPVRLIK